MTTIQAADLAAERHERSAAIDAAAAAIGHPYRRMALYQAIHRGETSATSIAQEIEAAAAEAAGLGIGATLTAEHRRRLRKRIPHIAYHVRELARAGILEHSRDRRGRRDTSLERLYRLAETPAATLARRLLRAAANPTHEETP